MSEKLWEVTRIYDICNVHYDGLPLPVNLHLRRGGVYRSKEYRQYSEALSNLYKTQMIFDSPFVDNLFSVSVVAYFESEYSKGDIDNILKPIMDAGTGIIWHDDKQIVRAKIEILRGQENDGLDISVRAIGECSPLVSLLICQYCGKPVKIKNSQIKRGRKHCSQECYSLAHSVECKCIQCGKTYRVRKADASIERRIKFCSQSCYHKYPKSKETCQKIALATQQMHKRRIGLVVSK